MLRTRVLTAVIGIPVLLAALYVGGLWWQLLIFLLATVALGEYLSMMRTKGSSPLIMPAYLMTYLLLLAPSWNNGLEIALGLGGLVMIGSLLVQYPQVRMDDFALSLTGAIYCGFPLSFALIMRGSDPTWTYLLLALLLTWSSDVGGYAFGRLWGKNKLAPSLSPAKTWEGAIGALVFSVFTAWVFSVMVQADIVGWQAVLVGITISLAAQIGDLWESSIKRYAGVKDTGHILPGHGGILDRFDSFMLVLPVMYYVRLVLGF